MIPIKVKNIIFLLMLIYTLIMISFGSKSLSLNDNLLAWTTFAMLNFLYWGFKWLKSCVSIMIQSGSKSKYNRGNDYYSTYESSSHQRQSTSKPIVDNGEIVNTITHYHKNNIIKNKTIEALEIQDNIKIISIDELVDNKKKRK